MSDYIQGIDVSKHQGTVDWALVATEPAVKANGELDQVAMGGVFRARVKFNFGIVKATEGVGYVDTMFKKNWKALRDLQDGQGYTFYRGAYHFARPDTIGGEKDGMAEAKSLCTTLLDAGGTGVGMLPPALDFEKYTDFDVKTDRAFVRGFVKTVQDMLGRSPMIYTGRNVWKYQLGNTDEFNHLPLWLVRYTTAKLGAKAHGELPWEAWTFWQWSGGGDFAFAGPVPGVTGACDVNRFNGTLAELTEFAQIVTLDEEAEKVRVMRDFHEGEWKRFDAMYRALRGGAE